MDVRTLRVLYRRAVRESLRVKAATWISPLMLPVFMVLLFGPVFSSLARLDELGVENYTDYMLPAAILQAAMLGAATAGVSSTVELQTGFFDRMRISPAGAGTSLLARRLADATRLGAFGIVLTVVGFLAGGNIENWLTALVCSALLAATWGVAYGGITLAACLRSGTAESAQALVPLFFPVLFMSTAFVPKDLLPGWLQGIAGWNPISYIAGAMREANAGALTWATGWRAVLGVAVAVAATELMVRSARRRLAER